MTIAWPSFLPKPLRVGHSYQPADVVARSEFNGGPSRSRQLFSAGPTQFAVSFVLDANSWAMFEAFFAYDLSRGAAEFTLPVESGAGVVAHVAKFVGAPAYDASIGGGRAQVTATVEVRDMLEIDPTLYAVVRDDYGGRMADYQAFLDLFEIFVNHDLPDSISMGA